MIVRDVMSKNVRVIRSDATAKDAAQVMRDGDIGLIPVASDDVLVGTISDRDLAIGVVAIGKDPNESKVEDHIHKRLIWCREDDTIEEAAEKMAKHQVKRLPVINQENKLAGILALADLARVEVAQNAAQKALKGISKRN